MLSLTWGFAYGCVRWSWALSDPVVVRLGGQSPLHCLAGRWMFRIMAGQVRVDADGGVPDDPACVSTD
jgi:hypothetical protein